jgi:hypothetical protein
MNPYTSKAHAVFNLFNVRRKYKYKKKTPRFNPKIKPFFRLPGRPIRGYFWFACGAL